MKVFLTGATGFLGEYLLAELLERGHSVRALYRKDRRRLDTVRFLSGRGLPRSTEALHWIKGDLLDLERRWEEWRGKSSDLNRVDSLLHNAASTRLHLDATGEPLRTNVGSARVLAKLAERHALRAYVVSTAYVCGLVRGRTVYEVRHPRSDFVNVYEESKWEAERIWDGRAAFLRPGIIVGDSTTGRCTAFTGWYILVQTARLLDRLLGPELSQSPEPGKPEFPPLDRWNLRIDLPANPEASANIVPVDYVAKAAVHIMENPGNDHGIYHLTHPEPPRHTRMLRSICERFRLGGIRFAGEDVRTSLPPRGIKRLALKQIQPLLHHVSNNPVFDRANTDRATGDMKVPPVSEAFIHKLIDYALEND